MKDCDGEANTISVVSIDSPIGSGLGYMDQCKTCTRWAGVGSFVNRFNGEWVEVRLLSEAKSIMICKASK